MFRYIAFLWDAQEEAACAHAARLIGKLRAMSDAWRVALEVGGLSVWAAGESLVASASQTGDGVVLGRRFEAGWGNYVTIRWSSPQARAAAPASARTGPVEISRAPASAQPCLVAATADVNVSVCCSWMESCAALDAFRFTINWPHLARTLVGPLQSSQTGLNEVHEIPAGYSESFIGGQSSGAPRRFWHPAEIATSDVIPNFAVATRELRAVTRATTHEWAASAPRILHMLSGGLDSSIVLGCLRDTPSEVTCLTHFAAGHDSDERYFARLAVEHAGCKHIEREQLTDMDLRHALYKTRMESSPGLRIPQIDRIEPDIALEVGAQAITRGHGGDELFCRHHTQYYVADFLKTRGFGRDLIPLLLHSATLEGHTIWTALAYAIRDAWFPRPWNLVERFIWDQEGESLLNPEVLRALLNAATSRSMQTRASPLGSPSDHMTLGRPSRRVPPGKLWQISLIEGRRMHHGPFARDSDPEPSAPLLSQPVIETCLRIPTWFQMQDRRERAVARAAFAAEVPQEILERRWKGGAEQLAWKLLRQNLPFVRELLLDGHLISAGLVDGKRLETLLTGSQQSLVRSTVPLFDLVGAEAWLQCWSGRGVKL